MNHTARDASFGARLLRSWNRLRGVPGGRWLFSRMVGRAAPYSGSMKAQDAASARTIYTIARMLDAVNGGPADVDGWLAFEETATRRPARSERFSPSPPP